MKTILMILNQQFLPDIRVEKEYKALKEAGYRVIVVADENGKDDDKYEIIRIKGLKSSFNKLLLYRYHFIMSFNKKLLKKLKENNVNKNDIITVHVHDLMWAKTGLYFAKKIKVKSVLDLHENYPHSLQDWYKEELMSKNILKRLFYKFFFNLKNWESYEIKMVKKFDDLIVVVPEAKERFPQNLQNKISIVSNTESPDDWQPLKKEIKSEFIISYIGGVNSHRGVDTLIKSLEYIDLKKYNIIIKIIGLKENDKQSQKIIDLVKTNNLEKNVKLISWIPFKKVQDEIKNSDLCSVPHNSTVHTETTVPHKIFQYMAMEKPVLVSNVKPLKRIVDKSNSGFIFEANNIKDCANTIIEAYKSNKLQEYGKNGRKAVETEFNWKNDEDRLQKLYNIIINQ